MIVVMGENDAQESCSSGVLYSIGIVMAVGDLTGVLGADAVTNSPLEVGLGVRLDKGVDWANFALLVTAIAFTGSSLVLLIAANTDEWSLIGLTVVEDKVAWSSVGQSYQGHQEGPHNDLFKYETYVRYN